MHYAKDKGRRWLPCHGCAVFILADAFGWNISHPPKLFSSVWACSCVLNSQLSRICFFNIAPVFGRACCLFSRCACLFLGCLLPRLSLRAVGLAAAARCSARSALCLCLGAAARAASVSWPCPVPLCPRHEQRIRALAGGGVGASCLGGLACPGHAGGPTPRRSTGQPTQLSSLALRTRSSTEQASSEEGRAEERWHCIYPQRARAFAPSSTSAPLADTARLTRALLCG
jgi:hypothetical protein